MKWFRSVNVEEVAKMPVDDQVKVAFLTLSHVDVMDSAFLSILGRIVLKELVNRGEEKLAMSSIEQVLHHMKIRHMGEDVSLGGEQ